MQESFTAGYYGFVLGLKQPNSTNPILIIINSLTPQPVPIEQNRKVKKRKDKNGKCHSKPDTPMLSSLSIHSIFHLINLKMTAASLYISPLGTTYI